MKKRLRKTGQIVDVISFTAPCGADKSDINDFVSYVDSKGDEYVNVPLNYYWDFEDIEEVKSTDIDWEQRRYEIAMAIMEGFASNQRSRYPGIMKLLAKYSIEGADALIAELRKEESNG